MAIAFEVFSYQLVGLLNNLAMFSRGTPAHPILIRGTTVVDSVNSEDFDELIMKRSDGDSEKNHKSRDRFRSLVRISR